MSLTGLLATAKKYDSRAQADRRASRRRRVGKKEKHSLQMNHSATSPSSENRDQTCLLLSTRLFPLSHSKLSALLPQVAAPTPASQCAIKPARMLRLIHASRSVALKRPPVADLHFKDMKATVNVAGPSETFARIYGTTRLQIRREETQNLIDNSMEQKPS